jgi:hypothetical protein
MVSSVAELAGTPMGSQSTVPLAWMPRRYCPAGQVPKPAVTAAMAPGANCALVREPGAMRLPGIVGAGRGLPPLLPLNANVPVLPALSVQVPLNV